MHRSRFTAVLMVLIGLVVAASGTYSHAVPPPTFSEILDGSPDIFVGRVTSTRAVRARRPPFHYPDGSAPIEAAVQVAEVLKGGLAHGDTVWMYAPDTLRGGPLLILGKSTKRRPSSSLHAYGGPMPPNELGSYVELIRQYLAAGLVEDPGAKQSAMIEWIVRCIEDEVLRPAGIHELLAGPWVAGLATGASRLTPAQCDRLSAVLESMSNRTDRQYLDERVLRLCGGSAAPNDRLQRSARNGDD